MFTLPSLPYDYDALEPFIDKETMLIHHDKHHAGYVNNLNDALKENPKFFKMDIFELVRNLTKVPESVKTKVTNNAGGHANHSIFWQIMAPPSGQKPEGKLAEAIDSTFGDFKTFQEKFSQAALGRFGSGWAWLVLDSSTDSGRVALSVMDTANQDTPFAAGKFPILGIDVWEHAYYLKYQNRRAEYIAAWWNVVNWKEVEKRLLGASG